MLTPYEVPDSQLVHPDTRCVRATQDRDLRAEALNEDACAGAALETLFLAYPPVVLGPTTIFPLAN